MATEIREPTNPPEISAAGEDFISRLPDELIAHILSYIPTKSSVSTAVLSKRWNRVWISVPNLDFGSYTKSIYKSPVKKSQFMDSVDRVLSLNNASSVREVRLYCDFVDSKTRVAAWMRSLTVRDCEVFRVSLDGPCCAESFGHGPLDYSLPDRFFNQNNLVELALGNFVFKVPPLVCFPRLKTIELGLVLLPDDDSMKNLMSGCPVLTHLSIHLLMLEGIFNNLFTLHICSSTLEHLTLHTFDDEKGSEHDVVIDAPKLKSLWLTDEGNLNFVTFNLPSLVCAEISILEVKQAAYDERLFKLLRKVSHVNELELSTAKMHFMEHVDLESLPIYQNLTKLTLSVDSCRGLPNFFHRTPNLVTFVLDLSLVTPRDAWYRTNDIPPCFRASLEHVTIRVYEVDEEGMDMASYFLKNAIVLKKLLIVSRELKDFARATSIRTRLMALPRSSRACEAEYKIVLGEELHEYPIVDVELTTVQTALVISCMVLIGAILLAVGCYWLARRRIMEQQEIKRVSVGT